MVLGLRGPRSVGRETRGWMSARDGCDGWMMTGARVGRIDRIGRIERKERTVERSRRGDATGGVRTVRALD